MAGSWNGTIYSGDDTNEKVTGTTADETIVGAGGSDTLRGGGGDDTLHANSSYDYYAEQEKSVDKLYGEAGDDELHGYALAPLGSLLDGGAGEGDRVFLDAETFVGTDGAKPLVFTLTQGGSYVTVGGQKRLFVKGAEELDYSGQSEFARITGGDEGDFITARGKGSTISGKGGADYLSTVLAAGATAVVDGGAGIGDSVNLNNFSSSFGGTQALTLRMSGSLAKGLTVKSGNAVVASVKGVEEITVSGGAGSDLLYGGAGRDSLFGGAGGNDVLNGFGGNDDIGVAIGEGRSKVAGDAGEDTLNLLNSDGLTKNVTMTGASLAKFVVKYGTAVTAEASGFERVTVTTGSGDDKVFGGALNDTFSVGLGANSVKAGAGNDEITSSLDAKLDTIDGGAGEDKLTIGFGSLAINMVGNGAGTGFTATVGGAKSMVATGVETLFLDYGSDFADRIVGLKGNDRLSGEEGNDTILGNAGDDTISGGEGNDRLFGGAGNDRLSAGSGVNVVDGGAGSDTAELGGGFRDDGAGFTLKLVQGKTVSATIGKTVIATLTGIESVTGSNYNDTITGDRGNNTIGGGKGSNRLDGGAGNDTVDYGSVASFGIGTGVTVTLKGASVSKVLVPNGFSIPGFPGSKAETDTIRNFENVIGTGSNDTLIGDSKANVLNGGEGSDTLRAGGGDDTLIDGAFFGGNSKDVLVGGTGNDTYEVRASGTVVRELKKGGYDTVKAGTSFTLGAGQEIEKLEAVAGPFGDTILSGYTLKGNEFANKIQGWQGSDKLTGGGGADTFIFKSDTTNMRFDTIEDFNVKQDTIALSRSVFKAFAKKGDLAGDAFGLGKTATTDKQHILYDSATGAILYDSDGVDKDNAPVLFALVDKGLKLNAGHFDII